MGARKPKPLRDALKHAAARPLAVSGGCMSVVTHSVFTVPSWKEIQSDSPAFARKVEERFTAGTNKTIATLRKDGSPRISGTELEFHEGQITLGMMGKSMKLLDVRRDPRVALHSPTIEPPKGQPSEHPGDAKIAGLLIEHIAADLGPEYPSAGAFEIDIREVVLTYVDETETHLVIESWDAAHGWRKRTRS